MVTIGKTFGVEEEVLGFLLVEVGNRLSTEFVVGDMEVSILSLLDPVSPLGSLETVSGPVPGILRLNNVELTVEAKGHHVVTNLGASAVHDHRVETVKTHDSEEVTGLDGVGVDIDDLSGAHLQLNTEGLSDEFNVSLFHVRGHVRSNNGDVGVIRDATDEGLESGEERLNVLDHVLAEGKSLDTLLTNISLGLWGVHLEG